MKSFEEFLKDQCFDLYPEVLDCNMMDLFFTDWLEKQNTSDLLIYSVSWGRHIKSYILQEVTNLTK